MFSYKYPRPCVTTDSLVFRKIENRWHILLVERANGPFKNRWALPGGFVEMDEDLDTGAARELQEETGLNGIALHQFHAFGNPNRDPRQRTITIAYWGIDNGTNMPKGSDDAAQAQWHDIEHLPPLAFDHDEIISMALSEHALKQAMQTLATHPSEK